LDFDIFDFCFFILFFSLRGFLWVLLGFFVVWGVLRFFRCFRLPLISGGNDVVFRFYYFSFLFNFLVSTVFIMVTSFLFAEFFVF